MKSRYIDTDVLLANRASNDYSVAYAKLDTAQAGRQIPLLIYDEKL